MSGSHVVSLESNEEFLRAAALDAQGLYQQSVDCLRKAANAGHLPATTSLARRLLVGRNAPQAPEEGAALLSSAAEQGDADALCAMATLSGAGVWGIPHSWPLALDYLVKAAEGGSTDARAQLWLIVGDDISSADNDSSDMWRRMRDRAYLERWVAAAAPVQVCELPRVWTAENFAGPALCAWLVDRGRGRFEVARMRNATTGVSRVLESRTCSDFKFDILDGGVIMLLLRIKISVVTGVPVPHMEPPQIFHYAVGQEIKAHYDFMYDGVHPYGRDGSYRGDRMVTFLMYLNEGYEGGELKFVKANYSYKGRTGDGVFFAGHRDGKPDMQSLHAAAPVISGEKYILSQWIHNQPFAA